MKKEKLKTFTIADFREIAEKFGLEEPGIAIDCPYNKFRRGRVTFILWDLKWWQVIRKRKAVKLIKYCVKTFGAEYSMMTFKWETLKY